MNYICFFTATILNWRNLLIADKYKDIIINSMRFLVKDNRVNIYAFVIMPNHLHLLWKVRENRKQVDIQRDFLKYTSQKIKFDPQENNPKLLEEFYVGARDRKYQIWERNALTSRLPSEEIIVQKINYIHMNPIRGKWKLAGELIDYKYSSARFYYEDKDDWGFLTHYVNLEDE